MPLRPVNDMAKLYLANTEQINDEAASALLPLLPAERQLRISRMSSKEARLLSIAAGGLLLYALRCAGLPDTAAVSYTDHGKPCFPGHPAFHFNLSHSGNWAACAVGGEDLGADVQKIVGVTEMVRVRCLASSELRWLESLAEKDRAAGFCRIWSLKEALLKADGKGLRQRPGDIQVLDGQGRICRSDHVFREFHIPGYAAAVCCRSEYIEEQPQIIDLQDLLC